MSTRHETDGRGGVSIRVLTEDGSAQVDYQIGDVQSAVLYVVNGWDVSYVSLTCADAVTLGNALRQAAGAPNQYDRGRASRDEEVRALKARIQQYEADEDRRLFQVDL